MGEDLSEFTLIKGDLHLKKLTLKKDWNGDIRTFDEGEIHLIKIADILSDGIIKQFPQKF